MFWKSGISISVCIGISFLIVSSFMGLLFSPEISAKPKTKGISIKVPYRIYDDKLEVFGYALDLEWPKGMPEDLKKDTQPVFYESPGRKWIVISYELQRDVTHLWFYNKHSKEKPVHKRVVTFWGSAVFWYGDEVVELTYKGRRAKRSSFVTLSKNPQIATLNNALFYDTSAKIYLALREEEDSISGGMLLVGKLFTDTSSRRELLGAWSIKSRTSAKMPHNRISEVIFDKETMIVKVDWVDKTRYVKFNPKFLKGRK